MKSLRQRKIAKKAHESENRYYEEVIRKILFLVRNIFSKIILKYVKKHTNNRMVAILKYVRKLTHFRMRENQIGKGEFNNGIYGRTRSIFYV